MILIRHTNQQTRFQFKVALSMVVILLLGNTKLVFSQTDPVLEQRINKLEQYVSTIQPTIVDLSNNLNSSIQEYTKNLESSLENYSLKLQENLDERLNNLNQKAVILNRYSKAYQSIESNTGIFLISVENSESIENGVRLYLNIGNPNFADYQNFQLKLVWGEKWDANMGVPYNAWRQSLKGAIYTFQGKIEKGKWNAITADLIPASGPLSHIECEMTVSSVELGFN